MPRTRALVWTLLLQRLMRDAHPPSPQAGHCLANHPPLVPPTMLVWCCRPAEHGDQRGPGAVPGLLPPQPGPGVRPPGSGCCPSLLVRGLPSRGRCQPGCAPSALPWPSARAKTVVGSTCAAPAQSRCICRYISQCAGTCPPPLSPLAACLPTRSWVYDNYVPLITASIIFSAGLSLYLYISRWVPSAAQQQGLAVVAEAGTGGWLGWVPRFRQKQAEQAAETLKVAAVRLTAHVLPKSVSSPNAQPQLCQGPGAGGGRQHGLPPV